MTNPNIPELTNLRRLSDNFDENNSQIITNINNLRADVSDLTLNVDISQIEQFSSEFIKRELEKNGLLDRVNESGAKVDKLLKKINFFGNSVGGGLKNLATGILSHGFSSEDEKN